MRQFKLFDGYGKWALVTVYSDKAVCLSLNSGTLDFRPGSQFALMIQALVGSPKLIPYDDETGADS